IRHQCRSCSCAAGEGGRVSLTPVCQATPPCTIGASPPGVYVFHRPCTALSHWRGRGSMTDRLTVEKLAEVLHEPQHVLLARIVRTLGEHRVSALLAEALLCERQGGMLTKDGRRRALGGVFLVLVREQTTRAERLAIFGYTRGASRPGVLP